ncbi:MAG: aspartate 1-decarboxylase [Planctomycetota bacterium]|jgi:aspartate 1-decarboxylase|nr:aspartate 1-decarboxylase [Planctomycetota bacterium]
MRVTVLKSKIHRATVTDSSLNYEGSISIPPSLVERAGLREYEKVLVANVNTGHRFETYVIVGDEGRIQLNGAAAHLGKPGDKVIIMAWTTIDGAECASFKPNVVLIDDDNQPKAD